MRMHDSGSRSEFVTGAIRDTATGKAQVWLLSPFFLRSMAAWDSRYILFYDVASYMIDKKKHHLVRLMDDLLQGHTMPKAYGGRDGWERLCNWLEEGRKKYSAWNWARGIPISRSLASLLRHLMAVMRDDHDEDHRAAAMCNVMFILHTQELAEHGKLPSELMDLPNYYAPWEQDAKLPPTDGKGTRRHSQVAADGIA